VAILVEEVRSLLNAILARGKVGTICLGDKQRFRRIFLEKENAYLLAEGCLRKLVISEELRAIPKLSNRKLFELAQESLQTGETLPETLLRRGLVEPPLFERLYRVQILEEMLDAIFTCRGSLQFFEGEVPDELIDHEGYAARVFVTRKQLREAISAREKELHAIREIIPSMEEVFVPAERGLAARREADDFVLVTLLDLIDGFRTVRNLVRDAPFYEAFVLKKLALFLTQGLIKKTVLPELSTLNPHTMTPAEASHYLGLFEQAVKYAADEVAAREKLATVYLVLDRNHEAGLQYRILGDRFEAMRRFDQAVEAYRKALTLDPKDGKTRDKLSELYAKMARRAASQGNVQEALELLGESLEVDPARTETHLALLEHYLAADNTAAVRALLDRAAAYGAATGDWQPTRHICAKLRESGRADISLQKRIANLLLDMGDREGAIQVMRNIGAAYQRRGDLARAREVYEKIRRLDPSVRLPALKHVAGAQAGPSRKRRRTLSWKALCAVLVLAFVVFQLISIVGYFTVARAEAAEQTEINLRRLAHRLPFSLGALLAEHEAAKLNRLRAESKQTKEDHFTRLLQMAATQEEIGDLEGAREIYKKVAERGTLVLRSEARKRLEALQVQEEQAAALLEKVRKLEAAGKHEEAFNAAQELIERYGTTRSAAHVFFPIQLFTEPQGAQVLINGEVRGKTPMVVHAFLAEPLTVVLQHKGCRAKTVKIEPTASPKVFVRLSRAERWRTTIRGKTRRAAATPDGICYVALADGSVVRLRVSDGSTIGDFHPPEATDVASGPVALGRTVVFATNDGRIAVFGPTKTEIFDAEALVKGPLVPYRTEAVFFPASKGVLKAFSAKRGTTLWEAALPGGSAVQLVVTGEVVLALLKGGSLAAFSAATGRKLWEKPEVQVENVHIAAVDEAVVRAAGRKAAAFDPVNGSVLWQTELPESVTQVLPDRPTLWIAAGKELLAVDGRSGEVTGRTELPGTPKALARTRRYIAVCLDSGEITAFDAATLQRAWYYKSLRPVKDILGAGDKLLVLEGKKWLVCLEE